MGLIKMEKDLGEIIGEHRFTTLNGIISTKCFQVTRDTQVEPEASLIPEYEILRPVSPYHSISDIGVLLWTFFCFFSFRQEYLDDLYEIARSRNDPMLLESLESFLAATVEGLLQKQSDNEKLDTALKRYVYIVDTICIVDGNFNLKIRTGRVLSNLSS